jgi:hypothetical protein
MAAKDRCSWFCRLRFSLVIYSFPVYHLPLMLAFPPRRRSADLSPCCQPLLDLSALHLPACSRLGYSTLD